MQRRQTRGYGLLVIVLSIAGALAIPAAMAREVGDAPIAEVAVRDVHVGGDDVVSGELVNRTSQEIRDVRVLVRRPWLWNVERHPGDDSPGQAAYETIAGPVPAGGTLPFRLRPTTPLPERPDGRYDASIEVVGFTSIGR